MTSDSQLSTSTLSERLLCFLRGARGEAQAILSRVAEGDRERIGRFLDPGVWVEVGEGVEGEMGEDAALSEALRGLTAAVIRDRSLAPEEQLALLDAARSRASRFRSPCPGWPRVSVERLFARSPIAALLLEADGRVSWRNGAASELLDYDAFEALGDRRVQDVLRSEPARALLARIMTGEPVSVPAFVYRSVRTGRQHAFAVQTFPVEGPEGGRPGAVCVLVSDRAAHSALAQRLDHSHAVFAGIIDAIGDPVLTCDAGWSVASWNRAAEEALHLSSRDTTRYLGRVVGRLGARLSADDLEDLLESQGELPLEVQGASGLVSYGVRVWEMPSEGEVGLGLRVVMLRDMRLELERQHHLRLAKERLEGLNRDLRHLNDAKVEFMNIVSHDLRSPLVTMRGYVEMVMREALRTLTDAQRKGLGVALRNAINLSEQIDTLLDYSRLEQGRMEYVRAPVAVTPLIHKAVDAVQGAASSKHLALEVRVQVDEGLRVWADGDKLYRVVRALLINAVKFTEEGWIGVEVRAGQRVVEVAVKDTGVGISPEELPHIFASYYQVGRGERSRGTGLGLSVARSLVEGQGSALHVESEAGQGSRFYFSLEVVPDGVES